MRVVEEALKRRHLVTEVFEILKFKYQLVSLIYPRLRFKRQWQKN